MKKLITLTAITLLWQIAFTQQFSDPGNQWNTKASGGWSFYNTELFRYSGDTMIMNTFYNKMFMTNDSASSAVWHYAGAIREWEGKVYVYLPGTFEEGLLYDFTIQAGDTTYIINDWCREPFPLVCVSTDSIEINGSSRKTFLFEYPYSLWIEGIGSLQGPLYSGIGYCVADIYYDLLCFYNNGNQLYMNPDATVCYETNVGTSNIPVDNKLTIYPNPSNGVFYLDFNEPGNHLPANIEIYNSIGKLVYHDPYCIDFRKPINLGAQPDGIFSIRINNDAGSFSGKLIKYH